MASGSATARTPPTRRITGLGVYANEQVQIECYGWGDSVGTYANRLWYRVIDTTRPSVGKYR